MKITAMLHEGATGGSLNIFLLDLNAEKKRRQAKGLSVAHILNTVARLKLFIENYKKKDPDRAYTFAMLGHKQSKTTVDDIVSKLFAKSSIKKAKELIKTNLFGEEQVDEKKYNQWIKEIRQVFINEEEKLINLLKK